MGAMFLIPCCVLSLVHPNCFHAQPVTTELTGSLSFSAMNQDRILAGMLDGSGNDMVVWANGEIVTRVTSLYESFGVLINNDGVAAGLGNNGTAQDDRLIIANASGEFDIVATIFGSAGWSSLTAINEQGSVTGNYSGGSGSSNWQAFLWTDKNGLQFIEPTAKTTYAYDVDEQNRVSGQIQIAGSYHAMLWDNGVIIDLAKKLKLQGHSTGRYFDASGRILISEFVDGVATFQWYDPSDSSLTEIHQFPVGSYTLRAVASEDGRVAFSWSSAELGPQLARWSSESGFEIATLDETVVGISVISLHQDGLVACNALVLPFYESVAMIWSEESSPASLHDQVPDAPTATSVIAMNAHGDLLVKGDALHWTLSTSCHADLDGNGTQDVEDLLIVLSLWGQTDQGSCGADIDGSGTVDVGDVLAIVGAWGPCE